MTGDNRIPLVRLNLVMPLIVFLEKEGAKPDCVLQAHGLTRQVVEQSDMFIPATKMYELAEQIAEASADPYFGAHAGERFDLESWSTGRGVKSSTSLGDLLLQFILDAQNEATSVDFVATVTGNKTTFSGRRRTTPSLAPRQNDAFGVAYLLRILQRARGTEQLGNAVLAQVCDPTAMPKGYLGIRLAACGTMGASVTFPSEWLRLQIRLAPQSEPDDKGLTRSQPPESTLEAIRYVLRQHLDDRDLNADLVAKLLGTSRRTLSRKLERMNTSLAREIAWQRRIIAEQELRRGELSVAAIGARIGYPDPAVFARAFKRWTGEAPSQYRRKLEIAEKSS